MNIGIIGSGQIGGTLARRLTKLGHKVFIANSRGPASLEALAYETGAVAVAVHDAARAGEIVFLTVPQQKVLDLPKNLFAGVGDDVAVVDTGNYYPQERDGEIAAIEQGMTESGWVATQLGRPVLKAINTLFWERLRDGGKPAGEADRIAIPIAGDNEAHKERVIRLFDQLGFDGVDGGPLDQSWRQQPGTPVYDANLDAASARAGLAAASPERRAEFRATPASGVRKT